MSARNSRFLIMALWIIRILFLAICTVGGYAVSQVRPEYVVVRCSWFLGMAAGSALAG